jgi:hypothetical protein
VARQKDRPAVRRHVLDQVPHPGHALRVEAVDGLVEDQRGWVAEQRPGDAEALAHAEGETADPLGGDRLQTSQFDDLVHPAAGDAVGGRQGPQVGAGAAAGMGGLGVEEGADFLERRGVFGVRPAVDRDAARRRAVEAEDEAHRRRFAGAVRPEKARDQARPDFKGQVVDGSFGAVILGQIMSFDHPRPSCRPLSPGRAEPAKTTLGDPAETTLGTRAARRHGHAGALNQFRRFLNTGLNVRRRPADRRRSAV